VGNGCCYSVQNPLCCHLLLEYMRFKYRQNCSSVCCLVCMGMEIYFSLEGKKENALGWCRTEF
jgi:hypothetical protein